MLGILDADESPSNEDASIGLDELNSLMATLAADGVDLGFPPQDNLSDDFPLDEQVEAQIKPLLALMLHAHYPAATPSPVLSGRAESARAQLLRVAVIENMEEAVAAVPLGSGYGYYYDIDSGE
jgi:hypothetical protein